MNKHEVLLQEDNTTQLTDLALRVRRQYLASVIPVFVLGIRVTLIALSLPATFGGLGFRRFFGHVVLGWVDLFFTAIVSVVLRLFLLLLPCLFLLDLRIRELDNKLAVDLDTKCT